LQDPELKCDYLDPKMPLPEAEVEVPGHFWCSNRDGQRDDNGKKIQMIRAYIVLVGGLEHFLFFHILE
jgi:hypothetical protein